MRRRCLAMLAILTWCVAAHADIVLKGDRIRLAFSSEDFHVKSFVGGEPFGEMAAQQQNGQ